MSRKLILASTMTMVLAGTDALALGLGGLNTQSVLNQPFYGEISLEDANPDELDAIKASLASPAAFKKAAIERYYYLTKLTFTPEVTPQGRVVLRVSSREPIREPYMDFLVEVVWSSGKLVKEYTVLLDPPVLANRGAPGVESARANGARSARAGSAASRASGYIPAPGDGFPIYIGPIRPGAGLWSVANENRPSGATLAQTAMALYRNNQGAFIRGNINRLSVGATLVIPTGNELFALDPAAAEREFAAALRGRAVRRSPITDIPPDVFDSRLRIAGAATQPTDSARGTAAVATPPATSGAVPPTTGSAVSPAVEQDVLRALETSESTRQETLELRDQVKELEAQLAGIQELLKLRDAELARIQSQADAPGVLGGQAPAPADPLDLPESTTPPVDDRLPPLIADEDVAQKLPEEPLTADAADASGTLGTQDSNADTAAPDVTEPVPADLMPVPVAGPAPEETPAVDQAEQPPAPKASPSEPVKQPLPVEEEPTPSTWDSLLLPLAGLAGVTALGILLFSWISLRRKRRDEAVEDEFEHDKDLLFEPLDVTTEPRTEEASDEDASTIASPKENAENEKDQEAGPSAEPHIAETTSNSSREDKVEETAITLMSSLSNFDAETDEADILSEADIYIAYGRHSEARELLRAELKRSPDRVDIKYKLAEACASAKDLQSLSEVLQEIEAVGGDRADPGMWRRLQESKERLSSKTDTQGGTSQVGSPPAAGEVDSQDSTALGLEDSLSLDISDLQKASSDSAGEADDDDGEIDLELDDTETPLKISEDLLDDLLDDDLLERDQLDKDRPDEQPAFGPDSEPDPFGAAPTVAVGEKGGFNSEKQQDSVQIESELVLTLDERPVEVIEDLDSIFDTATPDEPTLVRNEEAGARPVGPKETSVPSVNIEMSDSADQESVPTDLLSSQWQMDSGIWDETATKLDLARAYIEMDDAEAAREILEEVVAEGRDEQQIEARDMLSKLG